MATSVNNLASSLVVVVVCLFQTESIDTCKRVNTHYNMIQSGATHRSYEL